MILSLIRNNKLTDLPYLLVFIILVIFCPLYIRNQLILPINFIICLYMNHMAVPDDNIIQLSKGLKGTQILLTDPRLCGNTVVFPYYET